ncbi:YitT family protein [Heliorestis acidaminivorans]|uniref:YitT family protein n=1 Tax=Heliorestis acidaminivorans TaxID=553427 RepID=A0A6I0F5I5_9FIRM|nr:YitT family protein [Heliorestis acidaminivorans]KAB2952569.1 YitT family protein [Heliorestis acidaminivorans]
MSIWKKRIKKWSYEVTGIAIGAFIFAFGLNYFIIANRLAEGGLTGVVLILHYLFHWPVGPTYLALNLPLFIAGWRFLGRDFAWKTLVGTALVSLAIELTKHFQAPMAEDLFLAALYGGGAVGIGLGIIFYLGGSTGGADILARFINQYWGWPVGRGLLLVDTIVIVAVGIFFGLTVALYTLVAVFVATRVIDFVQEGAYSAKAAMIISDKRSEIAEAVVDKLGRGATLFSGRGAYTDQDKEVLYCVVSRNELVRLKALVYECDPKAFMIINDVHEVFGEGFRRWPYKKKKGVVDG